MDGTKRAPSTVVERDDKNGIDERSFRFFCDVVAFADTIARDAKSTRIIEQLVGAAGSIGSNREEALGGSSRREFIRYNEISLRSANETVRWLRVCAARRLGTPEKCLALLDEARQLARILAQIVITSKRRAGMNLQGQGQGPGPEPDT